MRANGACDNALMQKRLRKRPWKHIYDDQFSSKTVTQS